MRLILRASALALMAGLSGHALADETVTAWRLFVSDHAKPVVYAIDAIKGETIEIFDIKGPASLYRSDSGQAVYAVQGDAGAAHRARARWQHKAAARPRIWGN